MTLFGFIWFGLLLEMFQKNIFFGVTNVADSTRTDVLTQQSDAVFKALEAADPHSGFVYILYNSGIVGFLLYVWFILFALKRINYNRKNVCLFFGACFIYLFEGRSPCGVDISGILVLISVIIPFVEHKHKPITELAISGE